MRWTAVLLTCVGLLAGGAFARQPGKPQHLNSGGTMVVVATTILAERPLAESPPVRGSSLLRR